MVVCMILLHLRRQRILGDFSESSARYLGNVRILNSKGLQNTIKRMQNLITHHLPLPSSLTHRLCRIPQSNIMASRLFYNTNSELERDIVESLYKWDTLRIYDFKRIQSGIDAYNKNGMNVHMIN
jgi:hypothetical protein